MILHFILTATTEYFFNYVKSIIIITFWFSLLRINTCYTSNWNKILVDENINVLLRGTLIWLDLMKRDNRDIDITKAFDIVWYNELKGRMVNPTINNFCKIYSDIFQRNEIYCGINYYNLLGRKNTEIKRKCSKRKNFCWNENATDDYTWFVLIPMNKSRIHAISLNKFQPTVYKFEEFFQGNNLKFWRTWRVFFLKYFVWTE